MGLRLPLEIRAIVAAIGQHLASAVRAQQILGHRAFACIGSHEREVGYGAHVRHKRMQAQPEKDAFLRWDEAVARLRDRGLSALGAHKGDGLDRGRVHDEVARLECGLPREVGKEHLVEVKQDFAPAVVAVSRDQVREQLVVVAADEAVKGLLGIHRERLLHEREGQDFGVRAGQSVHPGAVSERVGGDVIVEVVD